jgi:very-short-patch-repair endonuclease
MLDKALTPSPSPSGRGEQSANPLSNNPQRASERGERKQKEAKYRAMAAKVMVDIARNLRQRETPVEEILWQALRNRRLNNLKFRRQYPLANTAFVADFFCYEAQLVIELDGSIHAFQTEDDALRQAAIESVGYTVTRFTNEQVRNELESVLVVIAQQQIFYKEYPMNSTLKSLYLRERDLG